jgi:hypothetical protein
MEVPMGNGSSINRDNPEEATWAYWKYFHWSKVSGSMNLHWIGEMEKGRSNPWGIPDAGESREEARRGI